MITVAERDLDAREGQKPAMRHVSVDTETSSISIWTLVIWLVILTVGILGIWLPYSHPKQPAKETPAVKVEMLDVELSTDPTPTPVPQQVTILAEPPPMPDRFVAPDAPPMIAVAEPTAVAFALPVAGPTRVVDAQSASYAKPATEGTAVAAASSGKPGPVTLTFGQGEGNQPAPEYPRQAVREGQQGVVTVRLSVGENGQVLSAEAAVSSPWRLLNEAALRVVRERWRFRSGPPRLYEVAIRFKLQN